MFRNRNLLRLPQPMLANSLGSPMKNEPSLKIELIQKLHPLYLIEAPSPSWFSLKMIALPNAPFFSFDDSYLKEGKLECDYFVYIKYKTMLRWGCVLFGLFQNSLSVHMFIGSLKYAIPSKIIVQWISWIFQSESGLRWRFHGEENVQINSNGFGLGWAVFIGCI